LQRRGRTIIAAPDETPILDARQLVRIESVHRGFLYQHLYCAACLLSAHSLNIARLVVERDEDLELTGATLRTYVQIKSRAGALTHSDIGSALDRFKLLRREHEAGRRPGSARFVIAANRGPAPSLAKLYEGQAWPSDVEMCWPGRSEVLPQPQAEITSAIAQCVALAGALPFGSLAPETLVWKLAGQIAAAAAGESPRADHSFSATELPALFEQFVFELQDLPLPPAVYRVQDGEPELETGSPIRIISGFSGAGKTSWVSQAAIHAASSVVYFDIADTPGPALRVALGRELAAKLYGRSGRLGEILLPGAAGSDVLRLIARRLKTGGESVRIVLDNAHRVSPADLGPLLQSMPEFNFILLCQPGEGVTELAARLSLQIETLGGWSADTIAAEVASRGGIATYADCQRLQRLTGGLPLFVRSAALVASSNYNGSIRALCDDLESSLHATPTAQELILRHEFSGLPDLNRNAVAVMSLSDVALEKDELSDLLAPTLGLNEEAAMAIFRQLRASGAIEIFGRDRMKVHDAMRLLGQQRLAEIGLKAIAQESLKTVLEASLQRNWDMAKVSLYLRILASVGDVRTLVQIATDEMFHELGIQPVVIEFLESASISPAVSLEDRFWALDALIFSETKHGQHSKAWAHLQSMREVLEQDALGEDEQLSFSMKKMTLLAISGDVPGVLACIDELKKAVPATPQHQRVLRYNAAAAMYSLQRDEECVSLCSRLIPEYYELLGLSPNQVVARNTRDIRPLLPDRADVVDDLKHLADALDLHSMALHRLGRASPLGRMHAMKFYEMANAPDSLVRVGQELVDDFVGRHDFIGAREVLEKALLPAISQLNMAGRMIPVRGQYAVVLAYCGDHHAAEREMQRLVPYEPALEEAARAELQNQRNLIAQLRIRGAPPQWLPQKRSKLPSGGLRKVGRNELCPCGSGKKYKKCHGES
jgi:hypothetical protein